MPAQQDLRKAVASLLMRTGAVQEVDQIAASAEFRAFAASQGVEALLYHSMTSRGLIQALPDPVRESLKRSYSRELLVEDLRVGALKQLSRALSREQLEVLIVKGTALAYTLYPEPHLRVRGDTDLLIPEEDRQRVFRLLESLGYRTRLQIPGDLTMYQIEYSREICPGFRMALDIHWRLSNQEIFSRTFSLDELLKNAIEIPGLGFQTASPVDALLLACLHRVAHHNRSRALIWLFDIHLLGNQLSRQDQDLFVGKARDLKILQICRDGIAETLKDFPSQGCQDLLRRMPAIPTTEPGAEFLQEQSYLGLLWSDFKALPWRRRFRWLREQLLPPVDYMQERYGTRSPVRLALLYCWRIVRGAWTRAKRRPN